MFIRTKRKGKKVFHESFQIKCHLKQVHNDGQKIFASTVTTSGLTSWLRN